MRKKFIFLSTLKENGFLYRFDGGMYITKVNKGSLRRMIEKITSGNIYNLFMRTLVGDFVLVMLDIKDLCDANKILGMEIYRDKDSIGATIFVLIISMSKDKCRSLVYVIGAIFQSYWLFNVSYGCH